MSIDAANDLHRLRYIGELGIDQKTFEAYIQANIPGYDITIPRTWPFITEQELSEAFGEYDGTQPLPRFAAYEASVMQSFVEKHEQAACYIFYPFNVFEMGNKPRKIIQMPKDQQDRFCAIAHFWSYYATLKSTDAGSDAAMTAMNCESRRWKVLELERDVEDLKQRVGSLEVQIKDGEIAEEHAKVGLGQSQSHTTGYALKLKKSWLTEAIRDAKTSETLLENTKDEFNQANVSMEIIRKRLSTANKNEYDSLQFEEIIVKLVNAESLLKVANEQVNTLAATPMGAEALIAQGNERENILKTDVEHSKTQLNLALERIKRMELTHESTKADFALSKKNADIMKAKLAQGSTQFGQAAKDMEMLETELEKKDNECAQNRAHIDSMKSKLGKYKTWISQANKRMELLRVTVKSTKEELENSKMQVSEVNEHMETMRAVAEATNAELENYKTQLSQVNEHMETMKASAEVTTTELLEANKRAAEATNPVSEGLLVDFARMKERVEAAELQSNKWKKRAQDSKKDHEYWQSVAERSVDTKYEKKLQKQARKEKKQLRKQKKRAQNPNVHEPQQTDNARAAPEVPKSDEIKQGTEL